MTEDQLKQETPGWLAEVGYTMLCGVGIARPPEIEKAIA